MSKRHRGRRVAKIGNYDPERATLVITGPHGAFSAQPLGPLVRAARSGAPAVTR